MIDLEREHVIPLAKAPQHCPGRPHVSTLHPWRQHGCQGIRLETLSIGGRRFTSVEALNRFFVAITVAKDGIVETSGQTIRRETEIAKAEAELDGHLNAKSPGRGQAPPSRATESHRNGRT